jgi:hypothetical protein
MTSEDIENNKNIADHKNNNNNDNDFHTLNRKGGKYLFGDYTPFEENKNFIYMLKDFVAISSNIIQIHQNTDKLRYVLKNAELFQNEMIAKVDQFKRSAEESLDVFHRKHNEGIINNMFPTSMGTDPFFQIKNALIHPLINGQREYIIHFEEYKKYIQSRIIDSYKNAVTLLQTLLSKDYCNLPFNLRANASSVVDISIDKEDDKSYRISRITTIISHKYKPSSSSNNIEGIDPVASPSSLGYSSVIDSSYDEFWRHKRKVSDIGIEDMSIPIGFKTPISQKLKRSFRFVSGSTDESNHNNAEKEPEFVTIDHYCIAHAKLESGKTLSLTLANDASELNDKVVNIHYDLADFNNNGKTLDSEFFKKLISEGRIPKIEYIEKQETRRLNLLQKEFVEIGDIPKILIVGKALLDKMSTILDMAAVSSSHIKLEAIKVADKEAVLLNNNALPPIPTLHYDEDLVVSFLRGIATGFSPLIQKLKEKSPVSGELILRYETDSGQRQEFTVKSEQLNSMLSSTNEGKAIATMLGLFDNQSSNIKTR